MPYIKEYKSGTFTKQYGYKSFHPCSINQEWVVDDPELNMLLDEATYKLGQLNAFSTFVPDVDVFIRMHIVKEATQSSRIEGTRTNIDEAVLDEKDISPESRDDWQEVQNYIEAMNHAINRLQKLPLSSRLFREAHKLLMKGVRGKHKTPGEYRTSQNWIGGATLKDASFVPPHHTIVPELIGDLEKFLNNEDIKIPHLIRIGMAHYQFEAIHPFLDGNGRIGRLLITLYLVRYSLLCKPTLYLSDFIERNRSIYYHNLSNVSEKSRMDQWLKFFLVGISETASIAIDTFNRIIALRDKLEKETIITMGRRISNAKTLLTFLYSQPIVTASNVMEQLEVSAPTANALIKEFQALGILNELTGYKRNKIFAFSAYLKLFTR